MFFIVKFPSVYLNVRESTMFLFTLFVFLSSFYVGTWDNNILLMKVAKFSFESVCLGW